MPKVNDRVFPYTPKGKKAAKLYSRKVKKPLTMADAQKAMKKRFLK